MHDIRIKAMSTESPVITADGEVPSPEFRRIADDHRDAVARADNAARAARFADERRATVAAVAERLAPARQAIVAYRVAFTEAIASTT